MNHNDGLEVKWNVELALIERGKKKIAYQRTHNIFLDTGRQMLCELMTASAFPTPTSFSRLQDSVVRYIGFGIGGGRQTSSAAGTPPLSTTLYPGTNTQPDDDVTVTRLERPIKVTGSAVTQIDPGDVWMTQVAPIASLTTATEVTYVATFGETDLLVGAASMPLSEIALFKSSASAALPNGSAGSYPGTGGHVVAYDTFDPLHKTGQFGIRASWTIRFG